MSSAQRDTILTQRQTEPEIYRVAKRTFLTARGRVYRHIVRRAYEENEL